MACYTNVGPDSGPLLHCDDRLAIDVFSDRDGREVVGAARCAGFIRGGKPLWRLTVGGARLPGLWVVADREFRPVG